jgi:hypothetical protein
MVLDPTDTAASTSARALIDFDPGSRTVSETGPWAVGAGQAVAAALAAAARGPAGAAGGTAGLKESGTATILPVRASDGAGRRTIR